MTGRRQRDSGFDVQIDREIRSLRTEDQSNHVVAGPSEVSLAGARLNHPVKRVIKGLEGPKQLQPILKVYMGRSALCTTAGLRMRTPSGPLHVNRTTFGVSRSANRAMSTYVKLIYLQPSIMVLICDGSIYSRSLSLPAVSDWASL